VTALPFSHLYQKVLTDWASGTNSVDDAVFAPQWMVDYLGGGYLKDIGARVAMKPYAQSHWFVTDVVGSMTRAKGTSQGTFFNTKDMTLLVDKAPSARLWIFSRNRANTSRRRNLTWTLAIRVRCSRPANAPSTSIGPMSVCSPSTPRLPS
jgi:hypothetical protein